MTTQKTGSKPAPLGRGLSALFGDTDAAYQPKTQPLSALAGGAGTASGGQAGAASVGGREKGAGSQVLPVTWLQPGTYQPRRHFDDEAITELADSIRERGVIQPLMVRPVGQGRDRYEIIAGERRWRAAQKAGLHEVPVLIRAMSDREAMEVGLIENVQREDLSPLEEAEGYKRLLEEFDHTQDGLAKVVGKSRPHITNLLRLLTLPQPVKAMIDDGSLTMGHARTLVTAKNPMILAEEIVKKGLSVRQAEALAKKESNGKNAKTKPTPIVNADILALEQTLERVLGLKVKLTTLGTSTAGSLTISYQNFDQLDALVKKLTTTPSASSENAPSGPRAFAI